MTHLILTSLYDAINQTTPHQPCSCKVTRKKCAWTCPCISVCDETEGGVYYTDTETDVWICEKIKLNPECARHFGEKLHTCHKSITGVSGLLLSGDVKHLSRANGVTSIKAQLIGTNLVFNENLKKRRLVEVLPDGLLVGGDQNLLSEGESAFMVAFLERANQVPNAPMLEEEQIDEWMEEEEDPFTYILPQPVFAEMLNTTFEECTCEYRETLSCPCVEHSPELPLIMCSNPNFPGACQHYVLDKNCPAHRGVCDHDVLQEALGLVGIIQVANLRTLLSRGNLLGEFVNLYRDDERVFSSSGFKTWRNILEQDGWLQGRLQPDQGITAEEKTLNAIVFEKSAFFQAINDSFDECVCQRDTQNPCSCADPTFMKVTYTDRPVSFPGRCPHVTISRNCPVHKTEPNKTLLEYFGFFGVVHTTNLLQLIKKMKAEHIRVPLEIVDDEFVPSTTLTEWQEVIRNWSCLIGGEASNKNLLTLIKNQKDAVLLLQSKSSFQKAIRESDFECECRVITTSCSCNASHLEIHYSNQQTNFPGVCPHIVLSRECSAHDEWRAHHCLFEAFNIKGLVNIANLRELLKQGAALEDKVYYKLRGQNLMQSSKKRTWSHILKGEGYIGGESDSDNDSHCEGSRENQKANRTDSQGEATPENSDGSACSYDDAKDRLDADVDDYEDEVNEMLKEKVILTEKNQMHIEKMRREAKNMDGRWSRVEKAEHQREIKAYIARSRRLIQVNKEYKIAKHWKIPTSRRLPDFPRNAFFDRFEIEGLHDKEKSDKKREENASRQEESDVEEQPTQSHQRAPEPQVIIDHEEPEPLPELKAEQLVDPATLKVTLPQSLQKPSTTPTLKIPPVEDKNMYKKGPNGEMVIMTPGEAEEEKYQLKKKDFLLNSASSPLEIIRKTSAQFVLRDLEKNGCRHARKVLGYIVKQEKADIFEYLWNPESFMANHNKQISALLTEAEAQHQAYQEKKERIQERKLQKKEKASKAPTVTIKVDSSKLQNSTEKPNPGESETFDPSESRQVINDKQAAQHQKNLKSALQRTEEFKKADNQKKISGLNEIVLLAQKEITLLNQELRLFDESKQTAEICNLKGMCTSQKFLEFIQKGGRRNASNLLQFMAAFPTLTSYEIDSIMGEYIDHLQKRALIDAKLIKARSEKEAALKSIQFLSKGEVLPQDLREFAAVKNIQSEQEQRIILVNPIGNLFSQPITYNPSKHGSVTITELKTPLGEQESIKMKHAVFQKATYKNDITFQCDREYVYVWKSVLKDKSADQSKSTRIENPKTYGDMIYSFCGYRPEKKGPAIKYTEIQQGDYFIINQKKAVFDEFIETDVKKYMDPFGTVRQIQKPKPRRQISDVELPTKVGQLQRYTVGEYAGIVEDIQKSLKTGTTPVINLPMGSGKTSHLMIQLAEASKETIYITMPNRMLAQSVYQSLQSAVKSKNDKIKVGRKIDSVVEINGAHIVVQTPAYISPGVLNVLDEFQFLSPHNLEIVQSVSFWKNLILMSATPFVPLLASAEQAGIKTKVITGRSVRSLKAWFLIGGLSHLEYEPENLADGTILFGQMGKDLEIKEGYPTILGINSTLPGRENAQIAHPCLTFGYSPAANMPFGIQYYARSIYTCSSDPGIIQKVTSLPPEFESTVQGLGRLSRNVDGGRLFWVEKLMNYTLHRFISPKMPPQAIRELRTFEESYNAKSTVEQAILKLPPLAVTFRCVEKNFVELGGQKYAINPPKGMKSAWGFTISGSRATAAYYSPVQGSSGNIPFHPLHLVDVTSGGPVLVNDLEKCPPGNKPVFQFNATQNTLISVAKIVQEKGVSTVFLRDLINAEMTRPIKSAPLINQSTFRTGLFSAMKMALNMNFQKKGFIRTVTAQNQFTTSKVMACLKDTICQGDRAQIKVVNNLATADCMVIEKSKGGYTQIHDILVCPANSHLVPDPLCKVKGYVRSTEGDWIIRQKQPHVKGSDYSEAFRFLFDNTQNNRFADAVVPKDPIEGRPCKFVSLETAEQILKDTKRTDLRKPLKTEQIEKMSKYVQGMLEFIKNDEEPMGDKNHQECVAYGNEFSKYANQHDLQDYLGKVSLITTLSNPRVYPECDGSFNCPRSIYVYLSQKDITRRYNQSGPKCRHLTLPAVCSNPFFNIDGKTVILKGVRKEKFVHELLREYKIHSIREHPEGLEISQDKPVGENWVSVPSKQFLIQSCKSGIPEEGFGLEVNILEELSEDKTTRTPRPVPKDIFQSGKCLLTKKNELQFEDNGKVFLSRMKTCYHSKDSVSYALYALGVPYCKECLKCTCTRKYTADNLDCQFCKCLDDMKEREKINDDMRQLMGLEKKKKSNSVINFLKDLWLILRGTQKTEQKTKTEWGSRIKIWFERKKEYPEIRRIIHLIGEQGTDLHTEFNLLADQEGFSKALVMEIILGVAVCGFLTFAGICIKGIIQERPVNTEAFVEKLVYAEPFIRDQVMREVIILEDRLEVEAYPAFTIPHRGVNETNTSLAKQIASIHKELHETGVVNDLKTRNKATNENSATHAVFRAARDTATLSVLSETGNEQNLYGGIVHIGANNCTFTNVPGFMISEKNSIRFTGSVENKCMGVVVPLTDETIPAISRRIQQWQIHLKNQHVNDYNSNHHHLPLITAFARDSIHDPMTFNAVFQFMKYSQNPCDSLEVCTFMPLVVPKAETSYSTKESCYSIAPTGIEGWARLNMTMAGSESYNEMLPTHKEWARYAALKGMTIGFTPVLYHTNLVYTRITCKIQSRSAFSSNIDTIQNSLGLMCYNEEGVLGVKTTATEKIVLSTALPAQKTVFCQGPTTMEKVAEAVPRSIPLRGEKGWLVKLLNFVGIRKSSNKFTSERNSDIFYKTKFIQNLRKKVIKTFQPIPENVVGNQLARCYLRFLNDPMTQNEYDAFPERVLINGRGELQNTGLTSSQFEKLKNLKFSSLFYVHQGLIGATESLHAVTPADPQGISFPEIKALNGWNDATEFWIGARDRNLTKKIEQSIASYPYKIAPFNVIHATSLPVITGTLNDAPTSSHVSQEKWSEMIKSGWNTTVLPKFEYRLGGKHYRLPDMPDYETIVQYCTCTNKKEQVFEIYDINSSKKLKNAYTQTCPVNLIWALIGRQTSVRVSPEKRIMEEFSDFAGWFVQQVTRLMEETKFKVTYGQDQIEQYLKHVEEKDKAKAKRYREAFDDDITRQNTPSMFVKCGQNQFIVENEQGTTRQDVKPRFINCPDYVIRARVGLVSYFTLKWFKTHFPEFFLGMTPEKLQKAVGKLDLFNFTYESDFSMFDGTNSEFLRLVVDQALFKRMVDQGLIKKYIKSKLGKKDKTIVPQTDEFFFANTDAPFKMNIDAFVGDQKNRKRKNVFKAKGKLKGTTYSGHPTCTTLCGTLRNFLIHLFAFWRDRLSFSFGRLWEALPKRTFIISAGRTTDMPKLQEMLKIFRDWVLAWFAGDDTGISFKLLEDSIQIEISMQKLCAPANTQRTHGLGYVLKKPKRDFKRICILSKHLASFEGKPIVLRMIPKLVLTNTTKSPNLTRSECHMLAAMSFYSYSMDPLSKKMIDIRLGMITEKPDMTRTRRAFYQDRIQKAGLSKEYTFAECAYAYNMPVASYISLVSSVIYENGAMYIDFNTISLPEIPSLKSTYSMGFGSIPFVRTQTNLEEGMKRLFQGGTNQVMIPQAKNKPWYTKILFKGVKLSDVAAETQALMEKITSHVAQSNQTKDQLSTQLQRGCVQLQPGPTFFATLHTYRCCHESNIQPKSPRHRLSKTVTNRSTLALVQNESNESELNEETEEVSLENSLNTHQKLSFLIQS